MSLAELTHLWMPKRLCLAVGLYKGLARGLVCEEEEEPAGWGKRKVTKEQGTGNAWGNI